MRRLPLGLRVLHWLIVGNFVSNLLYGAYQLFFVLKPESGKVGPLWGAAADVPHDLMMARRAYGTEVWITTGGLAVYLAVSEYLPRLLAAEGDGADDAGGAR